MLINEFETRTGFYPCEGLYNTINAAYNKYDGDKDAFCQEYDCFIFYTLSRSFKRIDL